MMLLDWFRTVIPRRHKHRLRTWHRRYVLGRGMKRASMLAPAAVLPDRVIGDLIYGWGNESMAAKREFIRGTLRFSWETEGHVLECGSGLSTLVAGMVAQRKGNHIWSLEHDPFWADLVSTELQRHGIDCVTVCQAPLRDFGRFTWYDTSEVELPADFSLVLCDGPPGDTHGGRYGLMPVCFDRLDPGCTIILDDAQRPGEQEALARWAAEFGARYEFEGEDDMIAVIRLAGTPAS